MTTSLKSTSYHSYSSTDMEGPNDPGQVVTPPASLTSSGIAPAHQFLYLKVLGAQGAPLSPALFAQDVIAGMFIIQHMVGPTVKDRPEGPLECIAFE